MNRFLFAATDQAQAVDPMFATTDIIVFFGFIIGVIALGIFMSREKKGAKEGSESYFLAGRGLGWWLIGFSLIAANISTEQFVGMSGSAARPVGLAIAGYEWLAAVTLVFVAFFFLPKFLKSGIYTIPEFLERRYGASSRLLMSVCTVFILVGVNITAVIFSGAKVFDVMLEDKMTLTTACWLIGAVSAIYVVCGGLKACAWADLIQGSALIIGGAIILYLALGAFDKVEVEKIAPTPEIAQQIKDETAFKKFTTVNADRLHTVRPADDKEVPWTALVIGLWIPNLFYWGLNQYIMQRALGAKSLAQGQGGIVFAAGLKLLIPFIVVFPGIMALNLYKDDHLGHPVNMKSEALKTNQYPIAIFEKTTGTDLPHFNTAGMDENQRSEADRIVAQVAAKERQIAFKFDTDFAFLYPEDTAKIIDYNAQYLTDPVVIANETVAKTVDEKLKKEEANYRDAKILFEKNDIILKEIDTKNNQVTGEGFKKMGYSVTTLFKGGVNPPEYIEVQKELLGYDTDAAFPLLLKNLVQSGGMKGFILAALMGAVMSSLASMLNAASTIMTMDLYKQHLHKSASDFSLVVVGRIFIALFVVIGCLIAPQLGHPKFNGIFTYIQEFQGFISPGILAIFLFGLFVRKAPAACGIVGLIGSPVIYGLLMFMLPEVAFLNRMAITFGLIYMILLQITVAFPRKEDYDFTQNTDIETRDSKVAKVLGVIVVLTVVFFYIYFW